MLRSLCKSHKVNNVPVLRGLSLSNVDKPNDCDVMSIVDVSKSHGYTFGLMVHSDLKSLECILFLKDYFESRSKGHCSDCAEGSINISKMFDFSGVDVKTRSYLDHLSFLFTFYPVAYDRAYRQSKFDIYRDVVDMLVSRGVNITWDSFINDPIIVTMECLALVSFANIITSGNQLSLFIHREFLDKGSIHPHEIGDYFCFLNQIRCPVAPLGYTFSQDGSYPYSDVKFFTKGASGNVIMASADFKSVSIRSHEGFVTSVTNFSENDYNLLSVNFPNLDTRSVDSIDLYKNIAHLVFRQGVRSNMVHVWSSIDNEFFSSPLKEKLHMFLLERRVLWVRSGKTHFDIYSHCRMFYSSEIFKSIPIRFRLKLLLPSHEAILDEIGTLKRSGSLDSSLLFKKSDYSNIFSLGDFD